MPVNDVALGSNVVASSTKTGTLAQNVVDHTDPNKVWTSAPSAAVGGGNEYIDLDLREMRRVKTIKIQWKGAAASDMPKTVKLQIKATSWSDPWADVDGNTWNDICDTGNRLDTFLWLSGQNMAFVRVMMLNGACGGATPASFTISSIVLEGADLFDISEGL